MSSSPKPFSKARGIMERRQGCGESRKERQRPFSSLCFKTKLGLYLQIKALLFLSFHACAIADNIIRKCQKLLGKMTLLDYCGFFSHFLIIYIYFCLACDNGSCFQGTTWHSNTCTQCAAMDRTIQRIENFWATIPLYIHGPES